MIGVSVQAVDLSLHGVLHSIVEAFIILLPSGVCLALGSAVLPWSHLSSLKTPRLHDRMIAFLEKLHGHMVAFFDKERLVNFKWIALRVLAPFIIPCCSLPITLQIDLLSFQSPIIMR